MEQNDDPSAARSIATARGGIVLRPPVNVKQAHGVAPGRPLLWLGVMTWWLLCGFGPPQLVDREIAPTARVSVGELRRWVEQSAPPAVSAGSFLVYDVNGGGVLLRNEDEQSRPPASLTKLMTALLALEQGQLSDVATVVAEDLVGGASMGLAVGDQVSVTDLLWGLLLPSGNDAAMVLARHVGGSVDAFVVGMKERAAALGMVNTRFVNPHGLDAAGHVSSAADMLRLTLAVWKYPLARSMMGTARVQWNGRELMNTNEWLGSFAGATGVKTGTTVAAGECLVASVDRDGRTLLVIVMGSQARYRDAEALYAAARRAYTWPTLDGRELSILNRVLDGTGKVWYMQPTGVAPTVMQVAPGMPAVRSFRRLTPGTEVVTALRPGSAAGTLEWWAGAQLIGTQSLVVR